MPDDKTTSRSKSGPRGPYRHLIGGEARGARHEPGDPVDPSTPPQKVSEWLRAGVIEPDKPAKPQKRKVSDELE